MRSDPTTLGSARLTTFDPILGTVFDNETFGPGGPLDVRLAQVGSNLRAVVLTRETGPRKIYLFDISPTGQISLITSTQLNTSIGSGGSNIVLSAQAAAGFAVVWGVLIASL